MKTYLLFPAHFIFILIFSSHMAGQNLVPNPGFEELNNNPKRGDITITCSKDWFTGYMMGTDYYNRSPGLWKTVPKNILGYQEPHSGDAYAGICIYSTFIEYLETKLLDTLKEGKHYLIEFYISRAETSENSVDEFGILFSDKARQALGSSGIAEEPSVKFKGQHKYTDKENWTKLSAVYQARGFETHLILGHFTYDHSGPYKKNCHYYIDDVSITPVEKESEPDVNTKDEDSIPKAKIEIADSISQAFLPKQGETVTLKNIFFVSNESELLPASFAELNKLASYLSKDPNTTIEISGHTDNSGNKKQNVILSKARAKAVADYLISKDIDKKRLKYSGYGSAKPIATNDTDEGRQLNRRVEFTINKK